MGTGRKPMQLDLTKYDGVPAQFPDTSKKAAVEAMPFAQTMEADVLKFIKFCGEAGATDAEIQMTLRLAAQTQVPRRNTLCRKGLVSDSGKRRVSPLTGRAVIVWLAHD